MEHTTDTIEQYSEWIKFLEGTTEDYLFILNITTEEIYFPGKICETYNLPCSKNNRYCIKDFEKIVYSRDYGEVKNAWEQIKNGTVTEFNTECRLIDRNGDRIWVSVRGKSRLEKNGTSEVVIGRISDTVFEHKVDSLTGLLNGECFYRDIEKLEKAGKKGYLLMLGVDELQAINMKYGRGYGNYILKTITAMMEEVVDPSYKIYRLDGDRYAVNLEAQRRKTVEELYTSLQEKLDPYCTVSGGAVAYGERTEETIETAEILYQYAETALDRAKRYGKNKLVFFSPEDYEKRLDIIDLQEELRECIKYDFFGFYLCYQPQIQQKDYSVFGAEALLRYSSPTRGTISPEIFIPILEQTDMMIPVGKWVLETALKQCKLWRETLPNFHISVNVSYVQMRSEEITGMVLELLKKTGLPGSCLTLEMTESMQLQNYQYFNRIFYTWKKHGIQIAIDDFGTGYSSLGYLKSMEINEVKIDRCFVNRIQHSAYNCRLISNMIELAHSAQIRVCCEGVETEEELSVLKEMEPDLYQGYLFAKPYETGEFEEYYIKEDSPRYKDCRERQKHFMELSCTGKERNIPEAEEQENMEIIVESMDEIVFVSDIDSYELYYINPAGRRFTGIRDYKGMKCYNVIQGRKEPCEFCTNSKISNEKFYLWEQENTFLGRHFLLKDKLISWKGKKARLEIAIDITDREYVSEDIQSKLDFGTNVVSCIRLLADGSSVSEGIGKGLQSIGEFYRADRAYMLTADKGGAFWNCAFEWCGDGILSGKEELQNIPSHALHRWVEEFNKGEPSVVLNLDSIRKDCPEVWEIMSRRGTRRLLAAPVKKDKKIVGLIGIDNPRHCHKDVSELCIMAYLLRNQAGNEDTAPGVGCLGEIDGLVIGTGGGEDKETIKNTPGNEMREHRMEGKFPARHCLQGAAPRYRDHVH